MVDDVVVVFGPVVVVGFGATVVVVGACVVVVAFGGFGFAVVGTTTGSDVVVEGRASSTTTIPVIDGWIEQW